MSDQNTTTALTYVAFITSLAGAIYAAVNHKRIRSNCCGKNLEASIDIGNITPPKSITLPPV